MTPDKFRTYLGDAILLIASGAVFIVQGIKPAPNLIVMGGCLLVLAGRVTYATIGWLGGNANMINTPQSSISSGSQSDSQSSSSRATNDPAPDRTTQS